MTKRIIRWTSIVLVLVSVTALIVWWQVPEFFAIARPRHEHCIKMASTFLEGYAESNGGKFPQSPAGWGDALLLLAGDQKDTQWIPFFVGVDDDGSLLRDALDRGGNVDESKCTRVYVQGLSRDSNGGIVILFDRFAVKGGDHFRGIPGQKVLREVIRVDSTHRLIPEQEWAEFVREQRTLLRQAGFADDAIDAYYASTINNHG